MNNRTIFRSFTVLLFLLTLSDCLFSQKHLDRYETIDIINYKFAITLSDFTDEIMASAEITIQFKKSTSGFCLDLVEKGADGKGMTVLSATEDSVLISPIHKNSQLAFNISETSPGEIRKYLITYRGIPSDGLIISKNKYNDRTFFGDNWPDRAKNWLPVADHPSDKATVEWSVTAPSHYQTVANGILAEKREISSGNTLTRWIMNEPVPTKVMVFGTAEFSILQFGKANDIPVSAWVYPQDRENGAKDFAPAVPAMQYYTDIIGSYPFEKLANVQSKTLFGGMENAGVIFYAERSVTGTGRMESLIAHEIAHQWFGNAVTELNWHHVWLSEGFATYFTNLYFEAKYGKEVFAERVSSERKRCLDYEKRNLKPVIDTLIVDYLKLLNANSYQKGSWVLHMLRHQVGDEIFFKGIRSFYNEYRGRNALTEDFQRIMEETSGRNLSTFFRQWLYEAGHPKLDINVVNKKGTTRIAISQVQSGTIYEFPIDLEITFDDGTVSTETISIVERSVSINLETSKKVIKIEPDPEVWLLFELNSILIN